MGVHMFDMVRWLMGLWPRRVFSAGVGMLTRVGFKTSLHTDGDFRYDDLQNWNHRTGAGCPIRVILGVLISTAPKVF